MGRGGAVVLVVVILLSGCAANDKTKPECDDGIDNDGDGKADHKLFGRGDSDCKDADDDNEGPAAGGAGLTPPPSGSTPGVTSSVSPTPTPPALTTPSPTIGVDSGAPVVINEIYYGDPQGQMHVQPIAGYVEVFARQTVPAGLILQGLATRLQGGPSVVLPEMAAGEHVIVWATPGPTAECADGGLGNEYLLRNGRWVIWDHGGRAIDAVEHVPAFAAEPDLEATPITVQGDVVKRSPDGVDTDRSEDWTGSDMPTPCASNDLRSALVINEISARIAQFPPHPKFVELYAMPGQREISLTGLAVVTFYANGTEASRIDLSGMVRPGAFVVVRSSPAVVVGDGCADGHVISGPELNVLPAGVVAIVRVNEGVALDAINVGVNLTTGRLIDGTSIELHAGPGAPMIMDRSRVVQRLPDGVDTDDSSSDLSTGTATPCAANVA